MQPKNVILALLATLAVPACAFAQANVTENQTTFVYVDANSGSDANPGTRALPFRTVTKGVSKASANNVSGIGTKVFINPGIYREYVSIHPSYRQTGAPMTFEATKTGTAIIAASDVLMGWSNGGGNPSIYSHAWNYNFGACAVPRGWPTGIMPIVLRTEMFFVNDMPLTQVLSASLMREGTFHVDEASNSVHIWPAAGTDMSTAVVEAAVRPQTLTVSGRTNMVIRGLVLRHAATCINRTGSTIGTSSNILVDSVQANWNSWGGLAVSGSNLVTLKNSVANHNGGVGFMGFHARNSLFQFDETDYNNWRGAMGALYDWGMGGFKFFATHSNTADQIFAYRNQAQGLWFDTDNKNITITNARLAENVLANLQIEVNEGPISLTGSSLCSGGIGVVIINSAKVTATGNLFFNNGGTNTGQAQIFVAGKSYGRLTRDWETGQIYNLFTENTNLHNNIFANAGPGQLVFGTYLGVSDWSRFAGTLTSNNNGWSDSSATNKFSIVNGKKVDLRGWQGNTGEDLASSWSNVTHLTSLCGVPAPSFRDFNVVVDKRSYSMPGGKGTINLHVTSFGYGTVALSVAGLPSGVTASYSQSTLVSGAPVLTLTASRYAANQTIPITIIATSGSRVHTVNFDVHVIPS